MTTSRNGGITPLMLLKVGDIVRLNYGVKSPAMTVSHVEPSTHCVSVPHLVECVWFDDIDTLHRDTFRSDMLELEYDGKE